jgi:hypothetical protein
MIVIWKGAGALVLLFGIGAALFTNIITSSVFNENNYFAKHSWAQAMSLWIAGTACWFLGRFLNHRPGRVLVDKATGQEVTLRPNHHLMFIKMEYWGPIFFAIGLCVLFAGAMRS